MTAAAYYGVLGNRDYLKVAGVRRPFWEYLDRQPDGWLTSLAYARKDMPAGRPMMFDCGAWTYREQDVPHLGRDEVTPAWALARYSEVAPDGSFVVAPDHMLIPGLGDLDARRALNTRNADAFLRQVAQERPEYVPMAVVHGTSIDERVQSAVALVESGYAALSLGGLAGQAARRTMALAAVAAVRAAVPSVYLHVLGLSSPSYAAAWAALGVQSFDGSSHFKQAFTGGTFYTLEDAGRMRKWQAGRRGDSAAIPTCDCTACTQLRQHGIDTRYYGSNENNMGRAAHNLNMLMRAQALAVGEPISIQGELL